MSDLLKRLETIDYKVGILGRGENRYYLVKLTKLDVASMKEEQRVALACESLLTEMRGVLEIEEGEIVECEVKRPDDIIDRVKVQAFITWDMRCI